MTNIVTPTTRQDEVNNVAPREAIYRLCAAIYAYPLAETQLALEEKRLQTALSEAFQALGGKPWPELGVSENLHQLEVGYMATFIHGHRGKPRVPLVASAYSQLIGGQTPGAFMLNVQAFYGHFGLTAAIDDEGIKDEPDHLVTMLEFCAFLCHLERQALVGGRDASAYRRAQRDFLARYLLPMLQMVKAGYGKEKDHGLDPNIVHLIEVLPMWANAQHRALENQVGPTSVQSSKSTSTTSIDQAMWN